VMQAEEAQAPSAGTRKLNKRDRKKHDVVLYLAHHETWPQSGRHVLAQYDDDSILVYQAYNPAIGHYAAEHKKFEGAPGWLTRMTWIKTNFLWMMFRSGWGDKQSQEVTLGIWLRREAFEEILSKAVHTSYHPVYGNQGSWKKALANSDVRLQWDPGTEFGAFISLTRRADHDPHGHKRARRAIQLGMKGETAAKYASGEWFVDVQDLSDFVSEQQRNLQDLPALLVAHETVYSTVNPELAKRLDITDFTDEKERNVSKKLEGDQ